MHIYIYINDNNVPKNLSNETKVFGTARHMKKKKQKKTEKKS